MNQQPLFDMEPAGRAAVEPTSLAARKGAEPGAAGTNGRVRPAESAPPDTRLVLGCDPGLSGAFALIHPSGTVEVADMPVRAARAKGQEIDWPGVRDVLRGWHPDHVYLEHVQPVGGQAKGARQGVTSVFKFGGAFHGMQAMLAALEIPYTLITAASWKRAMGLLGGEKDYARTRAMHAFPGQAALFKRKKDIGRAEAALLALAGEQKAGRGG